MTTNSTISELGSPHTASKLLDMYFLNARSHLLETAAILDRIERAQGGPAAMADPRIEQLIAACEILKHGTRNRSEQFLKLFSDQV
ncbi:MAG: hypothetical protein RBT11_06310 [Desulfobacterales bacterium]|jgi:molybdenum-dependent DNA-binding transcriptional regulator ModE|nr:hypothetical protein [Desulfobacterales bacterium]